jgi:GT2 family glycosyltransferase
VSQLSSADAGGLLAQVSVIVVLHDSGDVVAQCLTALPPEVEVVVVDNGSSDDGAATAARARPDLTLVPAGSNLGFGAGCQLGARAATRPWLLFLNPDAHIESDAILRLATTLARHPFGMVGPRLQTSDAQARPVRHQLDIRKDALWLLPASGRWFPSRWKLQPEPPCDTEYELPFLEGACFLLRRTDLNSIGGFDRDLFLYFEETSLGQRLQRHGGAAWYEPRATATHVGETSTGKRPAFATFHFYRSRVILERKLFGQLVGRLRCLVLLAAAMIAVARAIVHRCTGARADTLADAMPVLTGVLAGMRARIGPRYR